MLGQLWFNYNSVQKEVPIIVNTNTITSVDEYIVDKKKNNRKGNKSSSQNNNFTKVENYKNLSINYNSKLPDNDYPKRTNNTSKKYYLYSYYNNLNNSLVGTKPASEREGINYTHNKILKPQCIYQSNNGVFNKSQDRTINTSINNKQQIELETEPNFRQKKVDLFSLINWDLICYIF